MTDFISKMHPPGNVKPEVWFNDCYQKYKGHPLKILFQMYRGNYHKFVLSSLFFFVKHSPVWVLPIITASIINDVTNKNGSTISHILVYLSIMAVLLILNIPFNYWYMAYKSQATRYAETGLRKALIFKLQELCISYHVDTQSGRLQSKIMRDVEAVETLSTQLFQSIMNISLNIGIALLVTARKSPMVFFFFLITAPAAAGTMYFFRNIMKKSNAEFRKEMEATSASVMEMVELIPVTRAHALEDEEIDKISTRLFAIAEKGYRLDLIQTLYGSVGWVIFQLFQVVCLGFTGYMAYKSRIQAGDIALYQSYFASVVTQVSSIITLIPTIAKGIESVNSIGEVLLSDEVEQNDGKEIIETVDGEFDFSNVSFHYKDSESDVLKGLNLHVKKGETIALVGESGAGKSTILNMVIGFYLTNRGKVTIDGHDMTEIDLRSYRKHLAVVPQTSILFSGSIRENIIYGCEHVTEEQLWQVIDAANLRDLIEGMPNGLDTQVGEHGAKLSGGQRQRVSIARALIRNPQVIVLDEATSALDSISEKMIQEAIDNLTRERTTFIVAHRLSTIRGADRIAVIGDGHCIEIGSYEELMEKKGAFYELKKLQS